MSSLGSRFNLVRTQRNSRAEIVITRRGHKQASNRTHTRTSNQVRERIKIYMLSKADNADKQDECLRT